MSNKLGEGLELLAWKNSHAKKIWHINYRPLRPNFVREMNSYIFLVFAFYFVLIFVVVLFTFHLWFVIMHLEIFYQVHIHAHLLTK
jgi:hypothetical protein